MDGIETTDTETVKTVTEGLAKVYTLKASVQLSYNLLDGYRFMGYYQDGAEEALEKNDGKWSVVTSGTEPVTITAKYKKLNYTVTYNGTAVKPEGNEDTVTVTTNAEVEDLATGVTVPWGGKLNAFPTTKVEDVSDLVLSGWKVGTGDVIAASKIAADGGISMDDIIAAAGNGVLTTACVDGDTENTEIKLTAVFDEKTYTVSFYDENDAETPLYTAYNVKGTVSVNSVAGTNVKKIGYTPVYHYNGASGADVGARNVNASGVDAEATNVRIVVTWNPKKYTVILTDDQEGSTQGENTGEGDSGIALNQTLSGLNHPTPAENAKWKRYRKLDHYEIVGQSDNNVIPTNASLADVVAKLKAEPANSTITLREIWIYKNFKITVKGGGEEPKTQYTGAGAVSADASLLDAIAATTFGVSDWGFATGETLKGYKVQNQTKEYAVDNLKTVTLIDVLEDDTNGLTGNDITEIIFTAESREIKYTVKYNPGNANWKDGNDPSGKEYNYSDEFTLPTAKAFNYSGHNFLGWKLDVDGDYLNGNASQSRLTVIDNSIVTLTACWEEKQFKLQFEPNVPDDSVDEVNEAKFADITVTFGETKQLGEYDGYEEYTRDGFAFKGWNTSDDGSGDNVKRTTVVGEYDSDTDIKLYAVWEEISYTLKFDLNDSNEPSKPASMTAALDQGSLNYTKKFKITADMIPTRDDYEFGGWQILVNGAPRGGSPAQKNDSLSRLATTANAEITLKAQWIIPEYTINYIDKLGTQNPEYPLSSLGTLYTVGDVNGYTLPNYKITVNGEEVTILSREGYTFGGWVVTHVSDGEFDVSYTDKTVLDPNKHNTPLTKSNGWIFTLSAVWVQNPYTIKLDLNNGEGEASNNEVTLGYLKGDHDDIHATYDEAVKLPTLKRLGYTFGGWNTKADGKGTHFDSDKFLYDDGEAKAHNFCTGADRDTETTLYAEWTAKTYDVVVKDNTSADIITLSDVEINMAIDDKDDVDGILKKAKDALSAPANAEKLEHLVKPGYKLESWNRLADSHVSSGSVGTTKTILDMIHDAGYEPDDETITLQAVQTGIRYIIAYNVNGGEALEESSTERRYGDEADCLLSTGTTRAGYTFMGWKVTSITLKDSPVAEDEGASRLNDLIDKDTLNAGYNLNNSIDNELTTAQEDGVTVTLTAQWQGITYKIAYTNGDVSGGTDSAFEGDTMALQTRTFGGNPTDPNEKKKLSQNTYTRKGYVFAGWKVSKLERGNNEVSDEGDLANYLKAGSDFAKEYEFGADIVTPKVTDIDADILTVTLEAQWDPATYVIRFDGNADDAEPSELIDGEGKLKDDSLEAVKYAYPLGEEGAKIPAGAVYTRNGYTFTGYNTVKTPVDSGGISFEDNSSEAVELRLENRATTGGKIYDDLHISEGVITLYAQWEANKYTITFDLNDSVIDNETGAITGGTYGTNKKPYRNRGENTGSTTQTNVVFNDETQLADLKTNVTRTGYTFKGWNTKKDGSGKSFDHNEETTEIGDKITISDLKSGECDGLSYENSTLTLYAIYEPITYTIKYATNESSEVADNGSHGKKNNGKMEPQRVTYGESTQLRENAYTATGYTFDKWKITGVKENGSDVGGLSQYLSNNNLETEVAGNAATGKAGESDNWIEFASVQDAEVTLTVQWKPAVITFIYQDVAEAENPNDIKKVEKKLNYSDELELPKNLTGEFAEFVKDGHTLAGWTIGTRTYDPEAVLDVADVVILDVLESPEPTVTIVASYEREKFTIHFAQNDESASGSTEDQVFEYGQPGKMPENGYTLAKKVFVGWARTQDATDADYKVGKDADGKDYTYSFPESVDVDGAIKVSGEYTLYAVWKDEPKYTVVFDANTSNSDPNITLLDTKGNELQPGTGATGTVTFEYPVEEGKLSYSDLGGVIPAETYQLDGYTLAGWSTSVNGAPKYKAGDVVKVIGTEEGGLLNELPDLAEVAPGEEETITFYARWTPVDYTITYDANGGAPIGSGIEGQTLGYGETIILKDSAKTLANRFGKAGYTFAGWRIVGAEETSTLYDGGEEYNIRDLVNAFKAIDPENNTGTTITLKAQWTPNSYTITYNGNGGTGKVDPTTVLAYSADDKVVLDDNKNTDKMFKRVGYTFVGWDKVAKEGKDVTADYRYNEEIHAYLTTEQSVFFAPTPDGEEENSVELYAVWKSNGYTVKFNLNGGSLTEEAKESRADHINVADEENIKFEASFDNAVELLQTSDVKRTGYTFEGWSTVQNADWVNGGTGADPKFTGNVIDDEVERNLTSKADSTVTLYAQWKATTYTLTYYKDAEDETGVVHATGIAYDTEVELRDVVENEGVISFSKQNYRFVGWSPVATPVEGADIYEARSKVKNPDPVGAAAGTAKLYAVWAPKTVTVTLRNAAVDPAETYEMELTYDAAAETLKTVEETGFSYPGHKAAEIEWKLTGTENTGVDLSPNGKELRITADYTGSGPVLEVNWTPIQYKVVFHDNIKPETDNKTEAVTVTYGETLEVYTGFDVSYAGHKRVGYSTDKNANEDAVLGTDDLAKLTTQEGKTVDLYAIWSDKPAIITFYQRRGEETPLEVGTQAVLQNVDVDLKTAEKLHFTKNGYTLAGWTADSSKTVIDAGLTDGGKFKVADDVEAVSLYAVWEPNTYKVVYNNNTGEGTIDDTTQAYTDATAEKFTLSDGTGFTKTGYTFDGWYTNATGNGGARYSGGAELGIVDFFGTEPANKTLYAIWTPVTYDIVYKKNGKDADSTDVTGTMANTTVTYDQDAVIPANAYSRTGYTFAGWKYTDGTTEKTISAEDAMADATLTKPNLKDTPNQTVEFTAQWTANTYNVSFHANYPAGKAGEVTGAMTDQTFAFDAEATALTKNTFAKVGYTFKGWATTATATTVEYEDEAAVQNLTANAGATVDLYAVWEAAPVDITFHANNGTDVTETQTVAYNEEVSLTSIAELGFTKNGYHFTGWATSADGAKTINDAEPYTVAAGADAPNLYAVWAPDDYQITYNANGGFGSIADQKVAFDATNATLASNEDGSIKRTGYLFLGWSKDKDAKNADYTTENLTVTVADFFLTDGKAADQTLYAVWTPIVYTVVFDANADDAEGTTASKTLKFDETLKLTKNGFTRIGYKFTGWSTKTAANAGTDVIYTDEQVLETANLSSVNGSRVYLYAQWSPLTYKLTFDANGGECTTDGMDVTFGEAVTLPDETRVQNGTYQFLGWSREKESDKADFPVGGEAVVVNPVGDFADGDTVTLYAVWGRKNYTVNIYNEDKLLVTEADVAPATTIATILGDVRADKKHYIFKGWAGKADAAAVEFTTKDTMQAVVDAVPEFFTAGVINIYAVWEAESYKLTFMQNMSADDKVSYTGDAIPYDTVVTIPATVKVSETVTFENVGASLVKWNTKADGTGTSYAPGVEITAAQLFGEEPADMTLYAIWDENLYTVNYDSNAEGLKALAGESAPEITGTTKTQKFVTRKELLAENGFAAKGYEVTGWLIQGTDKVIDIKDAQDDLVLDIVKAAGEASEYKLIAQWNYTTYTITFHGVTFADGTEVGGKIAAGNKITYNLSETITLPTAETLYTLTGLRSDKYEFLGFFKESEFVTELKTIGKGGNVTGGDVDVYVKLNPKTYPIILKESAASGAASITQNAYFGSDVKLKAVDYVMDGYTHVGWSTTPFVKGEAGSMAYGLKDTISAADIDAYYEADVADGKVDGLVLYPYFANGNTTFSIELYVEFGKTLNDSNYVKAGTNDGCDVYVGSYKYGSTVKLPKPVAEEGTSFVGWIDANNNIVTGIKPTDAKNFKLRAWFTTTTYTVTFNTNKPVYTNAVSGSSVKSKVTGKISATLLEHTSTGKPQLIGTPELKVKGFSLKGWSDKPVASYASYDEPYELSPNYYYGPVTANMTLYAVWEMDVHTLTLVDPLSDNDTITLPLTIEGIASITGAVDDDTAFVHDNATLAGFATTLTGKGTNKVKAGYVSDLKLYARYNGQYTVTLHDGLASDATKVVKYNLQKQKALSANRFENAGYVFIGWSTMADGEVEYGNKQVLTLAQIYSLMDGTNIDLYAVWASLTDAKALTFDVNLTLDGDDSATLAGDYTALTYTYGTGLDLRAYSAVKKGYTFKGWFTLPTGGKQVKKISKTSVGNITLYARFAGDKVTVVYDAESSNTPIFGSAPKTRNVTKSVKRDKTLSIAGVKGKAMGYTFVGWSMVDQTSAISVADLGKMSLAEYRQENGLLAAGEKYAYTDIEDRMISEGLISEGQSAITLHAVWMKNEYTYSFILQGAEMTTDGMDDAVNIAGIVNYTYTADKTTKLPEPTKPGYTFKNWAIVKVTTNKKTGLTSTKYSKTKLKKFQTKQTSVIVYPVFKVNR